MFGKFLGSQSRKYSLPKNQIDVACPLCGAVQREPRLVVTTICRSCGEHLRVDKNRVVASSTINPVPSTVYPAVQEDFLTSKNIPETASITQNPSTTDAGNEPVGSRISAPWNASVEPPSAPGQQAAQQSTFLKMKEQGTNRQHHFKKFECFDCHNNFKVGRSAKSTNCPACGVYICLENFEINLNSTTPIRTRGDVLIRKNGNLRTTEIHCRNLTVHGSISGNIDCTGEFIISAIGNNIGTVRCHRLVIEKGSDFQFLNTIVANEAEVRSRITGNIQCHGPLLISATGQVHGDVTAHSVSIQPGGQLDGAMNILRSSPDNKAPSTIQVPSSSPKAAAPSAGRHD